MYRKVPGIDLGNNQLGLSDSDLRGLLTRQQEVPFDSDRKLMSTKHLIHTVPTIFVKGAIDVLLDRCDNIRIGDEVRPITDEDRKKILAQNEHFSENGLRVLTFAYKEKDEDLTPETEHGFTFIGLVSEMDPPREESIEAVARAKKAGIRTVMITGDHKVTAVAIAKKIGIFSDGDIAVTGLELDKMSDEELEQKIEKIAVYAVYRQKTRSASLTHGKRKTKIVSMTGDGVNDALPHALVHAGVDRDGLALVEGADVQLGDGALHAELARGKDGDKGLLLAVGVGGGGLVDLLHHALHLAVDLGVLQGFLQLVDFLLLQE